VCWRRRDVVVEKRIDAERVDSRDPLGYAEDSGRHGVAHRRRIESASNHVGSWLNRIETLSLEQEVYPTVNDD
jgi:hypothetical protein